MREELVEIGRAARELLRFQGELQLAGLDVASDLLVPRMAPQAVTAVPTTHVAAEEPAIAAEEVNANAARSEASRLIEAISQSLTPEALRAKAKPVRPARPDGTLQEIRAEIGDCTRCNLCKGRTNIVFGVGHPTARLMFIGEGPGRDEDLLGEPFVGPAGQLLDRMIVAMGLKRSDVYIADIVKCRPPKNRHPEPDEIAACEPFLVQQIQAIKPDAIVALGPIAAQTLLGDDTPISGLRGKWREYQGTPLLPTLHPAHLLQNPADKKLVWQDLQDVMRRLGLVAPAR